MNPHVSLGLPVFNGENFLEEAIRSLLAQTFNDFELIISDNASTDRTAEICRTYASQDARIRLFRAEANQGAAPNFNHVAVRAEGRYFKWVAHDDLCAPAYLETCVRVLDEQPDVVLCHTLARHIDENGTPRGVYKEDQGFDQDTPAERLSNMINKRHVCMVVFGVM